MFLLLILKGIVIGVLQFWAKNVREEQDMNATAVVHQVGVPDLDGEAARDWLDYSTTGSNTTAESLSMEAGAGTRSRVPDDRVAGAAPGKKEEEASLSHLSRPQWTQVGSDLDGEAALDSFGESISLSADGNRVAIGAIYSNGNDKNAMTNCDQCGQVRIYDWVGTQWTQIGSDFNGEAKGDLLGSSVALSADGNRVAIWAPGQAGSGGQVRLHQWNGTHWTQVGSDLNGEVGRYFAGIVLSGDGNRLVVGVVDYARPGNNLVDILVRIYDWVGKSQWTQVGSDLSITAAGLMGHDWSFTLSADGNRLAVSRAHGDGYGDGVDVRIYDLTAGSEQWMMQVGSDLSIAADMFWDRSMVALSEDGNRVATGVRGYHSNLEVGRVRIFDWTGSQWTQLGSDLDFEWLGNNIVLSADGNRLAINAPSMNEDEEIRIIDPARHGVVHVYDWTGSMWIQVGSDLAGKEGARSNIAISADGSHLAINTDDDIARWGGFADVDAGKVRIYAIE